MARDSIVNAEGRQEKNFSRSSSAMHIFRFLSTTGPRLGLQVGGQHYDLSAAAPGLRDISGWLSLADPRAAVHDALSKAQQFPLERSPDLLPPLDAQEVWACGVTYLRSKVARIEESEGGGNFYDQVYDAERPEIFFKSTAARVIGPGGSIRVRRDSCWNAPEPELVLVVSANGTIAGYTIGNDVSSRSIEGENPLYLPQAKIYDGSCALGPVIALRENGDQEWPIRMEIVRSGTAVFSGETSTAQLRRSQLELVEYLFRELTFSNGVFLFTGTGLVPPDDLSLQPGDLVRITIDGIGVLENLVT
jgi:2-dehydro-3-deoxy-D-arabinonate dehydratase